VLARLPLLAAPLLLVLPAGCAGNGASGADAGPPRSGGTLRLAIAANPDCIDPQQGGSNADLNVGRQLVDSLTDQDGRTGKLRPWLASAWSANGAATRFTFHLRHGVTFADGTALTAMSVKQNLDEIVRLGAKASLGSSYLAGYRGTTVTDRYTAVVRFAAPSAQFLQATSTPSLGLLSSASLTADPGARCRGSKLVGSGPFTVGSYAQNREVVLQRRAGYQWGSALFRHRGPAYLDTVDVQVLPESGVRTGALQSGQVDAATDVPPSDEKGLVEGGLREQVRANPGFVFSLYPNLSRPVLRDPAVRQALQLGVDRREIVSTVLTKSYRPATSVLAASTPTYTNLASRLAYQPAKARSLLAAAGWRAGSDGIRAKHGSKLRLTVIYASLFNQSQQVLELAQQQLKKVGVELVLKPVTPGEQASLDGTDRYDLSWGNLTRADPDILRTLFSVKFHNSDQFTHSPLESDLTAQASTLDAGRRAAISRRVQQRLIDGGYAVPVFELTQVLGVGPKAHGIAYEASSRLQLHDAWKAG
jgi:peptide/nickel transport system substrate-binding protein